MLVATSINYILHWPMHGGYNFVSGPLADITLATAFSSFLWIFLRKHNCHVNGCWRLQWHHHPDHGHPVCKHHHPHGKAVTAEHRIHLPGHGEADAPAPTPVPSAGIDPVGQDAGPIGASG